MAEVVRVQGAGFRVQGEPAVERHIYGIFSGVFGGAGSPLPRMAVTELGARTLRRL